MQVCMEVHLGVFLISAPPLPPSAPVSLLLYAAGAQGGPRTVGTHPDLPYFREFSSLSAKSLMI